MSDAVLLDATPLGILCHPRNPPQVMACRQWVADLLAAGRRVIVPEVADYEVRRELLRVQSTVALNHLDQLAQRLEYLPLTTLPCAWLPSCGPAPEASANRRLPTLPSTPT